MPERAAIADESPNDASAPGRLLARARRGAGLTQAQLAERLAISQAAVARLERPGSNPRIATLDRALRATGARLMIAAQPGEQSVDESLIRRQLELSATQRLQGLESMYREARVLSHAGEHRRGELADFRPAALLGLLSGAEIDFVVIGGVAVVLQASPRFTRDLDICCASDTANLSRLGRLLGTLGTTLRGIEENVPFVADTRTLRGSRLLTLSTREGDLDLIFDPPGSPGYAALRRRADVIELGSAAIRVASLEDLIAMKRASGRAQDQVDVESLEVARSRLRGRRRDGTT